MDGASSDPTDPTNLSDPTDNTLPQTTDPDELNGYGFFHAYL